MTLPKDTERTAAFMTPELAQAMDRPAEPAGSALFAQPAGRLGALEISRIREVLESLQPLLAARKADLPPAVPAAANRCLTGLQLEPVLKPQGWLARTTGQARAGMAEFSRQFHAAEQAVQDLRLACQRAAARHGKQAAMMERLAMRLNVEAQALRAVVESGARGLQLAHAELQKLHLAAAGDDVRTAALKDEAARYEPFVPRLKQLRALHAMLGPLHEALGRAQVQWLALAQSPAELVQAEQAWLQVLKPCADAQEQPRINAEWVQELHRKLADVVGQVCQVAPQAWALDDALMDQLQRVQGHLPD